MNSAVPLLPYYHTQEFTAMLNGSPVRFFSKPGLPDWDMAAPDIRLLAEVVQPPDGARILLLGCGHGALAVSLARHAPGAELWLADSSVIALRMAALTLQASEVTGAHIIEGVDLPPGQAGAFDLVIIDLPKGRRLAQRWLAQAGEAQSPGGRLYLAGANEEGIQAVVKDAAGLFGEPAILGYKKGNRVARFVKPGEFLPQPGWLAEPGVRPGSWQEFEVGTPAGTLRLSSLPGVFSSGRLDEGSAMLLPFLEQASGKQVLDLGCGYGLLGLVAAQANARHTDLVDESLLAVACAQKNLAEDQLVNARAFPSDALSDVLDRRYDLVVTNPPFHNGKEVDYRMADAFIRGSWEVLNPGGELLLVANRFIRYDRLMREVFASVHMAAETGRYQIFQARK